jgi:hypothetical protein
MIISKEVLATVSPLEYTAGPDEFPVAIANGNILVGRLSPVKMIPKPLLGSIFTERVEGPA